jgi:hypothetical protein
MAWGKMMKNPITSLLLLAVFLFTAACGDDAPAPQPYRGEPTSLEESVKKKRRSKKGLLEFEAKPEWDMMYVHYQKFVAGIEEGLDSKSVTWNYKDAFASHTEKFYPPVKTAEKSFLGLSKLQRDQAKKEEKKQDPTLASILSGMVPPEGADAAGGLDENGEPLEDIDTNPLTLYPLDKYVFTILMTGVANPEALVSDPEGYTHVLHLNDKLGLEGGYIVDILKHKVLVKVPDQDLPLEVSLAPATLPDSFVLSNR